MTRVTQWLYDNRMLIVFSVILVLSRLAVVFCIEELWPSLERLYTGTVVKEMADGMALPIWDYQFSSYEAGWILAAVVSFPVITLLGHTTFALSVCGVLACVAQFIILYRIIGQGLNQRVAWFFAMQFIVAPHFFYLNGLFLGFNYLNVVLLYAIFLVLFLKIFRDNRTNAVLGGPAMSVFCLGLLGGFFTWTCFAFLLIAVPCFVYWFCYHRAWKMKPIASFLMGFLAGISPLFFRIGTFAGGIKTDIVNKLLTQDLMGFVGKFKYFIGIETNMAQSVYANYQEILSTLLFVLIIILKRDYFGQVIRSLFQGKILREDDNGKVLLIWLYPLTFLTVFCLSGFADFRYFGPVYPFVFACNAIAIDLLLRYKSKLVKGLGGAALAGLLLFSVADSIIIPLYAVPPNLTHFRDKGYSYELLGCLVSWRFKQDPKRVMRIVNGLSDDEKRYGVLRGLGFELAIDGDEILIPEYISLLGNDYQNKPELLTAYNKGLVLGVGHQYFEETSFGEYYPAILRDIDREGAIKYFEKSIRLINFLDQRYKQDCFTGLGIQFSIVAQEFGLQAQNVARWVDVEYQDDFLRGIQLGKTYSYRI